MAASAISPSSSASVASASVASVAPPPQPAVSEAPEASEAPPLQISEQALIRELQVLRQHVQQDLRKEIASLRSSPTRGRAAKEQEAGRGVSPSATPRRAQRRLFGSDSRGDDAPHAWLSRHLRSYAAASEIAAAVAGDTLEPMMEKRATVHGIEASLLPDVIPKGTGPLACERRQSIRRSVNSVPEKPQGGGLKRAWSQDQMLAHDVPRPGPSSAQQGVGPSPAVQGKAAPSLQAWFEGDEATTPLDSEKRAPRSVSPAGRAERPATAGQAALAVVPCAEVDDMGARRSTGSCMSPERSITSEARSARSAPRPEARREGEPDLLIPEASDGALTVDGVSSYQLVGEITDDTMVDDDSSTSVASFASAELRPLSAGKPSKVKQVALKIVCNRYFEYLTITLIFVNACTIGLQTDFRARNLQEQVPPGLLLVDSFLAVFFTFEIGLRLGAMGPRKFFTLPSWRWNVLDLLTVTLQDIEELLAIISESAALPPALNLLRMLRALRIVKVIRIVRLLRYMLELRAIVVSVMNSMRSLVSSVVLLTLVIYIVGILLTQVAMEYRLASGCEARKPCYAAHAQELETYYGSVAKTTFLLFQTITNGIEWGDMVAPLVDGVSPLMGVIFLFFVLFTTLALMNIVTGVFVETAVQHGREDREMYMINHLRDLFGTLDESRNGMISWDELHANLAHPKLLAFFRDVDIDICEARGLFSLLDKDGSGQIDADEFLSGCMRLRGPAKALDLQLIMLELVEHRKWLKSLLGEVELLTNGPGHDRNTLHLEPESNNRWSQNNTE